ncbi:MAG: hypothetical protein JNK63_00080 [Chthonomonas sp.]|nr:hypothetical protein [Chthonomonas sp.]
MDSELRPLLVIDGDNLAHRAYHSYPKNESETNAIIGFFGMLGRIYNEEQPRGVYVAFDTLGVDTYRNQLWPPYQGGRVFDHSIVEQLGRLPSLCRAFAFGVGKEAGYEADDLMAAAALGEAEAGGKALLLTADRDSYQLVSESITVISPQRGTRELARIGPRQVVERMGVLPEQVPDFKALAGDASDKIPGVRGCGPKSAAAMLLKHGTLDRVVAEWTPDRAKQILMFREVARMRPEVPVELPSSPPDWAAGADALAAIGLTDLATRMRGM